MPDFSALPEDSEACVSQRRNVLNKGQSAYGSQDPVKAATKEEGD